jgi:predicted acetyltransferase
MEIQMDAELRAAAADQRSVIENLLELYQYDIAEYANDGWRDIGGDGRYGYDRLAEYWEDATKDAFLVYVGCHLAGFALVDEATVLKQPAGTKSIAEFFVLRKYRVAGVGRAAAAMLFERFPGHWEVAQDEMNKPAQRFWTAVIGAYTGGRYSREFVQSARWCGPVLSFRAGD